MPITIPWDDVEPGVYDVEIIDAEITLSSTGNETLFVRVELEDGNTALASFSMLPQAVWKLRKFLKALGFGRDNEPEVDDLVGIKFQATFTEDDNGRVQMADFAASEKPAKKPAAKKKTSKAAAGKKGARDFKL
jgi:hypothetical protein